MGFMGTPPKRLFGNLVYLREIDLERDAPEWFEAMQEPAMHTWTGNHIPRDIQEVRDVVLTTYATHPDIFAWCIRDKQTDKIIGLYWIGVAHMSEDSRLITFDAQRIAAPYWRKGYTKAIRTLVYQYAFLDLKVEEIRASAWEQNVNSCLSMESAGFELARSYPRFNSKYNSEFIEREYVLRREKWNQLNSNPY
jgi:[ribosomal protein S5]-alanine N-acetyltransferase